MSSYCQRILFFPNFDGIFCAAECQPCCGFVLDDYVAGIAGIAGITGITGIAGIAGIAGIVAYYLRELRE